MRYKASVFKLSRFELIVALLPSALALAIAVIFFGQDSYLSAMAHGVVALLTFPGFVTLEFARLATGHGSLHGDAWDLLSIPLAILVSIFVLEVIHILRTPIPPV